jgi:hypothetical protein
MKEGRSGIGVEKEAE